MTTTRRTRGFTLRLTEEELRSYREAARRKGISMSEWVRGWLRTGVRLDRVDEQWEREQWSPPEIRRAQ